MKLLFLLIVLLPNIIKAQIEEITLEFLKNNSSDIVITKTKSIVSYQKNNNRTFSDITIEVLDNIKGKLNVGNTFTLTYYGGTIDGITTLVLESPGFTENEESVLFLTKNESKKSPIIYYKIMAGSEGKFNIINDDNTKEKMVIRDKETFPLAISSNKTDVLFYVNQSVKLEEFIQLIKQ